MSAVYTLAAAVRDARCSEESAVGHAERARKYGGRAEVAEAWVQASEARARWAEAVFWMLLWMQEGRR